MVDSRVAAPQIDPQIASPSEMARASSLSAESSSGRFWMTYFQVGALWPWLWWFCAWWKREEKIRKDRRKRRPPTMDPWLFAVRAREKLPEVKPAISRLKLEIEVHDTSGKSKRPPLSPHWSVPSTCQSLLSCRVIDSCDGLPASCAVVGS